MAEYDENLQLNSDFTYASNQSQQVFTSAALPGGAGSAVTSINSASGPAVTFGGGSTGYSFSGAGANVTMTGGAKTLTESSGPTTLDIAGIADGTFLKRSGTTVVGDTPTAGAPSAALFVVLAADAGLTNERILTGTANQIILADGGAGGNIVLSTPQNIHTAATPQFARLGLGAAAHATEICTVVVNDNTGGFVGHKVQNTNAGANAFSGMLYYDNAGVLGVFQGFNNSTHEFRFNNVASTPAINFLISATSRIKLDGTGIGFFAAAPVAKPTVTGSRAGNAALASVLTALADLGLITNSSTA